MDRPGIYTTLNYVHDYMYILPGGGGAGSEQRRCLLAGRTALCICNGAVEIGGY